MHEFAAECWSIVGRKPLTCSPGLVQYLRFNVQKPNLHGDTSASRFILEVCLVENAVADANNARLRATAAHHAPYSKSVPPKQRSKTHASKYSSVREALLLSPRSFPWHLRSALDRKSGAQSASVRSLGSAVSVLSVGNRESSAETLKLMRALMSFAESSVALPLKLPQCPS